MPIDHEAELEHGRQVVRKARDRIGRLVPVLPSMIPGDWDESDSDYLDELRQAREIVHAVHERWRLRFHANPAT